MSDGEIWPMKVDVKVEKSNALPVVLLDEAPIEITSVNFDESQWVLANVNATSFIRVNYEGSNWAKLTESLLNNPDAFSPITQAQIINDFCFFYKLNFIDASNGKEALASVQKFLSQLPKSENPLRMVVQKLKC